MIDMVSTEDTYKGKRINPDELMGITPKDLFSFNGYAPVLKPGQRLYPEQTWLRDLNCEGCHVVGYDILPGYGSEDLAEIIGEKPESGIFVLPCTDCGTIFQSYSDKNLPDSESDDL